MHVISCCNRTHLLKVYDTEATYLLLLVFQFPQLDISSHILSSDESLALYTFTLFKKTFRRSESRGNQATIRKGEETKEIETEQEKQC